MNRAIFWRVVWKEYRQQRALWVAIALAGLIFQAAVLIYCALNGAPELSNKLFTVALSVPVLYSLGCGAALFAGEHEAEAFPFQQSLPVSAGQVFLAKFTFAAWSALLLFPVLWLLAFAMASWKLPDALWHAQLWGGGVVATMEVLIWSVLGSLVMRRVLPAAIVSGVTAALLGCGSLALMAAYGDLFQRQANEYFSTLPLRTGFALIALATAVKFGRQWFDERPMRWTSPTAQHARSSAATQRRAIPATGLTVFARLLWHEWRQGRATMLSCVIGYVVLGTWMSISQFGTQAYVGLLPVLATICGASVFAADQRQGQFQFFTEHGVRPRLVWLSRQLVWGSALIVLAVCAVLLQTWERRLPFDAVRTTSAAAIGIAFLMFASGQVCSILIRSGIVAVFTAAMCSILLFLWTAFTGRFGVLWVVSALPLPFIFFWASWRYAPEWIQQRQTWPVRIVTAATILVPLLGVVAATAAYRVYEIPAIKLSFDPTIRPSGDSPAARETAEMYREADQILRGRLSTNSSDDSAEISSRDDEWRKGIELFVAASQRPTCHFDSSQFDGQQLTRAVLAEAQARTEAGDLEGAAELHAGLLQLAAGFYDELFDAYGTAVEQRLFSALPEWANHESLTAPRLLQGLATLQAWSATKHPDFEASIIANRRRVQQFIALDDEVMYGVSATERAALKAIGTLLPWERWRMLRLLDVQTEAELQGIRDIRARAIRLPPQAQSSLNWDVRLDLGQGQQQLIRSTQVDAWLSTTPWLQQFALTAPSNVLWEKRYQVRRGAVQLQLALIAWRKEHGELPDALRDLVGNPFETLPTDPFTGQRFVYCPDGVEEEVWDDAAMGMGGMMGGAGGMMGGMGGMSPVLGEGMVPSKPRLVRSEPFLWSPGEQLRYAPGSPSGRDESSGAGDFRDQQGHALSDQSLLHLGVRFPLPIAKQQPPDSADDAAALPIDE